MQVVVAGEGEAVHDVVPGGDLEGELGGQGLHDSAHEALALRGFGGLCRVRGAE